MQLILNVIDWLVYRDHFTETILFDRNLLKPISGNNNSLFIRHSFIRHSEYPFFIHKLSTT
ncbi:hypothetical protein Runsl_2414 [Runella slithyformis DSM 19594]|uniref:Uncharacterized protein n=1 Tax=Runella slithyformis (strain ATCC 29530 / DSM 19594 / LMG 11500 / NCIMB 11436 / LSU 4) TaxID=761193 RepID=A0A7U3ZKC3_RUNSL|nr:hypothetical protein Runsl_2414 [Runella slithyformis DSM 19594]